MPFNHITPDEAAQIINNGATLGLSGFTAPGTPKGVTEGVARKAIKEHEAGREYKVNIFTGASTNRHVDTILAENNAINRRAPYQNLPVSRQHINTHDIHYFDRHLSEMAQETRYGFYGPIDFAIIEAADITDDGKVLLGCGLGNVPTYAHMADKIFIEINHKLPKHLHGMHDVVLLNDPPYRREVPIYHANDRIGSPVLKIDPKKIVGIIDTEEFDGVKEFTAVDETSTKIGNNVVSFLLNEYRSGRIPKEFLPLQSGVGNVAWPRPTSCPAS